MQREAGQRLRVAPRFHNPIPWPERIRLSDTAWREGQTIPKTAWRPTTDAELSVLLAETALEGETDLCLFTVPEHLRALWWELAANSEGPPAIGPLARAVADFARFKGLTLPSPCSFDVVVTPPGQERPRTGGTAASESQPAAGINLGDERTSVVLSREKPVRLFLEPGEGLWVPSGSRVADGYTAGKEEIDVWLLIQRAADPRQRTGRAQPPG